MKKNLLILVFISIGLFSFSQSVTTNAVTDVSFTEAHLYATYTDLGTHGIQFQTGHFEYGYDPLLNGTTWIIPATITTTGVSGDDDDVFLLGLTSGTTYYYRFVSDLLMDDWYTVNTYTGGILSFTTLIGSPSIPLVSPPPFLDIEKTTLKSRGYLSATGGAVVFERGTCWNLTGDPSISDSKAIFSSDYTNAAGLFLDPLTGFSAGVTYYFRAYATNSEGTGYALVQEIIMDTEIPICDDATSVIGSGFTANWQSVVGAQGYYFEVSSEPDFSSFIVNLDVLPNVLSYDLSGLSTGNTYYYRVRSYHDGGANAADFTSDYSNVISILTLGPSLTTTIPSSITKISADVGGNVTSDNGSAVTERGICWGLITGVTTADTKIIDGSGTGSFSASMSSLSAGTQYYYNSYAINSIGTGYGIEKNFITNTIDPTCTNATNITESSFNANWGAVIGAQGYYLDVSTVSNFGSFVPGYENLDVTNVTTYNVTGLSSETVYFYRVRAYHDGGDNGVDFTSGSSANKNTTTLDSEPDVQASEIEWENNGGDILLEWIDGNGEGNMLIMKASSNVTNPVDGVEYTANAAFGSGTQIGAGTYVMYRSVHFDGTASVLITNVVNGVDYYFKVLEYSGQGITTNYNLEDNTDGFGIGNIGTTTLPVELIYFGAEKTSNSVTLNWITASEINNDYFILEHSKDGKNFEEIVTVDGSGNSNLTLDYSYEDKRELEGTNYYRLRQVDFDGKETTFSIVSVNCGINDKLEGNVYVDNTILNVELNSESYDATMIRLIDINGRNMQFVISKTQGPNTVKFDMSDLARGIYFVRIERGEEIISKKIVY